VLAEAESERAGREDPETAQSVWEGAEEARSVQAGVPDYV